VVQNLASANVISSDYISTILVAPGRSLGDVTTSSLDGTISLEFSSIAEDAHLGDSRVIRDRDVGDELGRRHLNWDLEIQRAIWIDKGLDSERANDGVRRLGHGVAGAGGGGCTVSRGGTVIL